MAKKTKTYIFEKDLVPTLQKTTKTKSEAEIREELRRVADAVHKNNLSPEYPTGEIRIFPNSKQRVVVTWNGFGAESCNVRGLWTPENQAEYSDIKTEKKIKDDYRKFSDDGFEKIVFGAGTTKTKKVPTKKKAATKRKK